MSTQNRPSSSMKEAAKRTPKAKGTIHSESKSLVKDVERALKNKNSYSFTVLDNGAEPFKITITRQPNNLFAVTVVDNYREPGIHNIGEGSHEYYGFKKTFKNVQQVWLGSGQYDDPLDRSSKHFDANTAILVQDGGKITSISRAIRQFKLKVGENITRVVATVGNSAVPYGYIETTRGYYAIPDFNCVTGFLPLNKVQEEDATFSDLSCWDDEKKPWNEAKSFGLRLVENAAHKSASSNTTTRKSKKRKSKRRKTSGNRRKK